MNGAHDLGGMHGLGPISPEPESEEPVFHGHWEERVFALTLAAGFLGQWSLDQSRFARERQHPVDYLSHSYYENWLAGLETLLVESGLLSPEELTTGHAKRDVAKDLRLLEAKDVAKTLEKGGPSTMQIGRRPRFQPGDRVRVSNEHPLGHTRVPRYIRGRTGVIQTSHGAHVFADRSAIGIREGQPLYNVMFLASELWGTDTDPGHRVYVDVWEPHLNDA